MNYLQTIFEFFYQKLSYYPGILSEWYLNVCFMQRSYKAYTPISVDKKSSCVCACVFFRQAYKHQDTAGRGRFCHFLHNFSTGLYSQWLDRQEKRQDTSTQEIQTFLYRQRIRQKCAGTFRNIDSGLPCNPCSIRPLPYVHCICRPVYYPDSQLQPVF